jgi:1,4-dihydroxy-6-naphthoate synthase
MRTLTLGFSPCPNDTFIFHALVHGVVSAEGITFEPFLDDVETLNQKALAGELHVTKVSYGVLPYLLDRYRLLRSGGALGRGCGPLLVAKRFIDPEDVDSARIAIPGRYTTANLLLRLFAPEAAPGVEMDYARIMSAVAAGQVDAGLIIHESRFTYPDYGLLKIVDLGEWWESTTGTPIPLGAIVARHDLGVDHRAIDSAIRRSVEHALRFPADSESYVRRHAQEMDSSVREQHISLYVNDFTVDLGDVGIAAVRALMERARAAGLISASSMDPFQGSNTT